MASVNKVIIIGNLGADPELRYTPSNIAVCTLSVATTDYRNDREGNRQEITEWHRIVVWNKAAENCAKYLTKGRAAYFEGRLQTRSWDDKNTGQKRYSTEIVADRVQFLGGRDSQAGDGYGQSRGQSSGQGNYGNQGGGQGNYGNQGGGQGNYGNQGGNQGQQQPASEPFGGAPDLEDIPF